MVTTPQTLLDRLRANSRNEDWDRFARLYTPLLLKWARLQGFRDGDAEDLVQVVLLKLLRLLPGYRRREGHSFRGWLSTICRNEARDFRTRVATRPLPPADGLPDVTAPIPEVEMDEAEYRRQLVRRALDLIRPDFGEATWAAFTGFVLGGRTAATVAADLGLSANAVYLARNRILTRLREELAGLFE